MRCDVPAHDRRCRAAKLREPRVRKPVSGLGARDLAVSVIHAVLDRHRAFEAAYEAGLARPECAKLEPRDRGLARLIAATVLRRSGELRAVTGSFLEKPL